MNLRTDWKPILRFLFVLSILSSFACKGNQGIPSPPIAKKIPVKLTHLGQTRVDNYRWLQDREDPEVLQYLKDENDYAETIMKGTENLQETLYREMVSRMKETDLTVPYPKGNYDYYDRTEKGKQYPIYCRKKHGSDGKEEILLDLNELAEGQPFLGLGLFEVSDNEKLLAYSLDTRGFREYTLFVKNLETGEIYPDRIDHVESAVWAADSRTLYYTREDETKRPDTVHSHRLQSEEDDLIYDEPDDRFRAWVTRSRDGKYIFLVSYASSTTEYRYIPADRPGEKWTLILPRELGHEYLVDHRNGEFFIQTNRGAENYRIVKTPVTQPSMDHWVEVVPHRADVMIEGFDLFQEFMVVREKSRALQNLRILNFTTGESHGITFEEEAFALYPDQNEVFNTPVYRFSYESPLTPESTFEYRVSTREKTLLKQKEVPHYDPARYTLERIWAKTSDGKEVPITLIRRNDIHPPEAHPLVLDGYGAYGFARPAVFRPRYFSLLDRGVIFALAHVRGGDEMGKLWYEDGKLMHKKNTFTDFIACAEHLISAGYTNPDLLVATGGSAGGLLMGAITNMRPDLFKSIVTYVPFVDVINTMLNPDLPLTTEEYLEWGNPNEPEAFAYIRSYCPYTNLEAKDYPAILVKTSLFDSQVMFWEPAKYVARLRSLKTDHNELLLVTNMDAGHGGASGRYDALREDAFDFAWILRQVGHSEEGDRP
ncbi:MAG TPA: S9 family peptidase [Thermoanaerobaculia bacterium]|nr:S9 family peptidase [Thermoanaerobaculia bacterium]HUM30884.1 S9 family peptidase [Thermoanaerobaculia bacterium]HXK69195.1 S9 family peptidase [Thermoanaerobaculia bacterium]